MARPSPLLVCDLCNKEIKNSKKNFISHINRLHQNIISTETIICDLCNTIAKDKEKLHNHNTRVHHASIHCWSCDQCDRSFKRKVSILIHIEGHQYQAPSAHFTCKQGNKKFQNKPNLDRHIRFVHATRSFECDCCGKAYTERKILAIHFQAQHQQMYGIKCPKCADKFAHNVAYATHKLQVHGDIKYVCDQCGHACNFKDGLKNHFLAHEHRRKPFQKLYECSECSANFRTNDYLKNHISAKHKGKQFHCDSCPAEFASKCNLTAHINSVHLKLRPFKCPDRMRCFVHSMEYVYPHIANVHRLKLLHCDECAARFRRRSDLAQHFLGVHMNVRQFKCGECVAAYSSSTNLKGHKRSIHGE